MKEGGGFSKIRPKLKTPGQTLIVDHTDTMQATTLQITWKSNKWVGLPPTVYLQNIWHRYGIYKTYVVYNPYEWLELAKSITDALDLFNNYKIDIY
jgi:hypothetical protein